MIAEVPQPVSSVVALAHRVCEAHGATLFEVRSSIRTFGEKRSAVWVARRQRIVYAMRHAQPMRPSFPEIAQALGMPNHSTAITAYRREVKRLAVENLSRSDDLRDSTTCKNTAVLSTFQGH